VLDINQAMRSRVLKKIEDHLGSLQGKTIGILGLAFKPHTDDIREAPALALMGELIKAGATVRATDPVAIPNASSVYPDATFVRDAYGAAMGADAVVLVTEWDDYRQIDPDRLANAMRGNLVIDGRNVLTPQEITAAGLVYEGIGRGARTEMATSADVTSIQISAVITQGPVESVSPPVIPPVAPAPLEQSAD
jgi:UDPglucose 6-dehydrogenase